MHVVGVVHAALEHGRAAVDILNVDIREVLDVLGGPTSIMNPNISLSTKSNDRFN
jgi:hypothetical protein